VLILCGPFADHSHRLLDPVASGAQGGGSTGDVPDSLELVRRVFRDHVVSGLQSIGDVKCVIIPSLLDLHCPCVFPQPPFEVEVILPGADNLYSNTESLPTLSSNPCTFRLNEIVISVSTADILLHLSGSETSRLTSDRLSRLARHVLEQVRSVNVISALYFVSTLTCFDSTLQRSFYPLFPASEGTQISMSHMHESQIPVTPDILILPSQLNPFAKLVGDVLCINPGRLTKGSTAGTFVQATIHPIIRNICPIPAKLKSNNIETVKIESDVPGIKPHKLTPDFEAVNNDVLDPEKSIGVDPEGADPNPVLSELKDSEDVKNKHEGECITADTNISSVESGDKCQSVDPADEQKLKSETSMPCTGESVGKDEMATKSEEMMTHRVAERTRVEIVRI
jgi:hypothetical protein